MDDDATSNNQLIAEFVALTEASPTDVRSDDETPCFIDPEFKADTFTLQAEQYLAANRWDLSSAAAEYFTAQEETDEQGGEDPQEPEAYTGPRTLDGRPAPQQAIPVASTSSARPKRGGVATLGSLGQRSAGGHAGHGHAHDDDDDDQDEDYEPGEEPRDLFAGGEKSGLAVQDPARNDPKNVVNDILKKARAYV